VGQDSNVKLIKQSLEKIKDIAFSLAHNRSPAPNGFLSEFYYFYGMM
jgi:hypothetical protein